MAPTGGATGILNVSADAPSWLEFDWLGAGFQDLEMKHDPEWRSEIRQVIWVACCVISMALIGILPTIPLFIFLYMIIQGEQKVVFSVLISALVVIAVGSVFEIFLEYDLYRGMLLNQD